MSTNVKQWTYVSERLMWRPRLQLLLIVFFLAHWIISKMFYNSETWISTKNHKVQYSTVEQLLVQEQVTKL